MLRCKKLRLPFNLQDLVRVNEQENYYMLLFDDY